jgi:hypothetical protein
MVSRSPSGENPLDTGSAAHTLPPVYHRNFDDEGNALMLRLFTHGGIRACRVERPGPTACSSPCPVAVPPALQFITDYSTGGIPCSLKSDKPI